MKRSTLSLLLLPILLTASLFAQENLPPAYPAAESGLDGQVQLNWLAPGTELINVEVEIFTDLFWGETSWDIVDASGVVIATDEGLIDAADMLYNWEMTLTPAEYTFTIYDSYGDGICCAYGDGYYNLYVDGEMIASGGDFETSESVTFGGAGLLSIIRTHYDGVVEGEKGGYPTNLSELNLVEEVVFENPTRETREFTGYVVYRDGVDVSGLLGVDVFDYLDGYIANGVEYCYTIEAVYDVGDNASTDPVCATPMNYPPAMPTGLVGTADNMTVTLDWDDNTEYDFFIYNVYRGGVVVGQTSASNFSETLADGGIYNYYVTALDEEEAESDGSDDINLPVGNLPPVYLSAESDLDGMVNLEWSPPGTTGPDPLECADYIIDELPYEHQGSNIGMLDDFDVTFSDGEDVAYQLWMPDDGMIDITLCSEFTDYDTKLEIFNEDCFTSTGFYNDDNFDCEFSGLQSGLFGVFLPEGNYLIVVDGFGGSTGNYGLTVTESAGGRDLVAQDMDYEAQKLATAGFELATWELSSAPVVTREAREFTGYNVYRDGTMINDGLLGVDVLTYADFYIPNGVEYCYMVEAVYDEGGNSVSETVCATPMNHPPATPLNLTGTVDDMTVSLDWDDNNDEYDFDHYNIYRSGVYVASSSASEFTETLEFGSYYHYTVVAVDAEDLESAPTPILTLPVGNLPPMYPTAESGLDGQVYLTWMAPGVLNLEVTVEVFTDNYPGETSWDIVNADGDVVATDGGIINTAATLYTWDVEVTPGVNTFTIYDSFGDGICCAYGEGYYNLIVNGDLVATGGDFGASETIVFGDGGALMVSQSRYDGPSIGPKGQSPLNLGELELIETTLLENQTLMDFEATRDLVNFVVHRDGVDVSGTLATDVFEYLDGYIPNGIEYMYTIEGVYDDGGGNSMSVPVFATPMNHPPAAPQNLTFVIDDHDITLNWDANTEYDFASYNVYRDDEFVTNTTATTFGENLPVSNIYRYYVTAVDAEDAESDPSSRVTLPVGNLPPSFAGVEDGLDGTVVLSWSEPGLLGEEFAVQYDDGVLENAFYYYDIFENGFAHGTRFEAEGLIEIMSAQVKILSEGDNYWPWPNDTHGPVRIIIMDDDMGMPGNVVYDEEVTAEDGWATINPGLAGVEGAFYVIVSHTEDWSAGGDPEGFGVDGFVDYPDNMYTLDGGVWYTGDYNFYGGDYMVRATVLAEGLPTVLSYAQDTPVYSEDQILANRQSSSAARLPDASQEPTGVSSRPYPGTVPYTTRDLVEYQIYRSETSPVAIEAGNLLASMDLATFSYVDFPLTNGVTQYYHVAAYYDDPETSLSPELMATPMNHPPMAPMGLSGSGDEDANVVLDWDDNTDYDFASYNVYRDDVFVANVATSDFSENVTDPGLYDYFVTAVDAEAAESAPSDDITVPTGPLPPGFVTATSGIDGQVFLEWTAPGDVIMNFSVEIFTDNYPGETSWDLMGDDGEVANDGGIIGEAGVLYTWDVEISPGLYTFNIYDSFGDGICCAYGEGYYNIYLNGTMLATGGDYGAGESWTFDGGGLVTLRTITEYVGTPEGEKGGEPTNLAQLGTRTQEFPLNIQYDVSVDRERTFDGFNVYRDGSLVNTDGVLASDTYAYLDGYIPNGVEYMYTVSAVYTTAETHSDPVYATPMNHPPMVPMNLIGSVDDGTGAVSLDWDDNTDYDIASYNVYANDVFVANVATSEFTETPNDGVYGYRISAVDAEDAESDLTPRLILIVGEAPPENLAADGHHDDHIALSWRAPGSGEEFDLSFDSGILENAFYYYAPFEDGFAHGNRFDPEGSYDVVAASVKILSEGDPYWPWPDPTHGPVRVIIMDDAGGMPGAVIHDEEVTAEDGWATVYPNVAGLSGSFYVIASHAGDWSIEGDPEGFGVDDGVDFPDNMVTMDGGVWYTGDLNGYGGDYMIRATVFGQGAIRELSNDAPTYSKEDVIAHRQSIAGTFEDGVTYVPPTNLEASAPVIDHDQITLTLRDGLRDIDFFNVYRDGDLIAQTTEGSYHDMVEEGEPFFYAVTATYTNGEESGPSNEVEAFAWMAPLWPLNVVASVTGHSVTLEWIDPDVNEDGSPCVDLEGIVIYRNGVQVGSVGPLEWEFTETGVPDGPQYYELMAHDEALNMSVPAGIDVWIGAAPYILQIFTDNYPGETSWDITDNNGNVVMGITPGELTAGATLYEWILDIEPGNYTFNIYDSFGDGICCAYGDGFWQIVNGADLIASGGEFADVESVPFTVEEGILYGDLDNDGLLTISDLVRLIEIVTFTGAPPTNEEIAVIDMNADGAFNVLDVVILLEAVLEFPGLARGVPVEGTAAAEVPAMTLFNTREWQDIPVSVTYDGFISGFQADVGFDPSVIELGTPTLGEGNDNVSVYTNSQDGIMRVLAVDLAGGQINVETGLLMNIPVQVIDENASGSTDFTIDELILAGPGGTPIEVDVVVSVIEVGLPLPEEFSLAQNYPNPFNPSTTIGYALPEAGDVQLVVYNMLGQAVRTLVGGYQDAGYYDVLWNGVSDSGELVPTGIYIYHLRAGNYSKTYKMAFIK